jgi:hemerythrin
MGQDDFTRWQPCYSVGNWMLDCQHKVILGLFRDAIQNVPSDNPEVSARFNAIQSELLDSVDAHFRTEESLLCRCRYARLETHRDEHTVFKRKLENVLASTISGKVKEQDLRSFLSRWWFDHVLESDSAFVTSIQRVP